MGLGGELERCGAGWGAREVQGWVGSYREVQGWVGAREVGSDRHMWMKLKVHCAHNYSARGGNPSGLS